MKYYQLIGLYLLIDLLFLYPASPQYSTTLFFHHQGQKLTFEHVLVSLHSLKSIALKFILPG